MNLRKMLKFRLPSEESQKYLDFHKEKGKTLHHFTKGFRGKKHNDFLTYNVNHNQHEDIHVPGIEDQEEATLQIIANLIKYVKYLEQK